MNGMLLFKTKQLLYSKEKKLEVNHENCENKPANVIISKNIKRSNFHILLINFHFQR